MSSQATKWNNTYSKISIVSLEFPPAERPKRILSEFQFHLTTPYRKHRKSGISHLRPRLPHFYRSKFFNYGGIHRLLVFYSDPIFTKKVITVFGCDKRRNCN